MEAAVSDPGVVIGVVLPLLIEAVGENTKSPEAFRMVSGNRDSDHTSLEKFCKEVRDELNILDRHIVQLIRKLPDMQEARKTELLESRNVVVWEEENFVRRLQQAFDNEQSYAEFNLWLNKVRGILWTLVGPVENLEVLPQDSPAFLLRNLPETHQGLTLVPSRPLRSKKNLQPCLKNLSKRVASLGDIIRRIPDTHELPVRAPPTQQAAHMSGQAKTAPSRRLSKLIFTAMATATTWNHSGSEVPREAREARFFLADCDGSGHESKMILMNFLIRPSPARWLEAEIQAHDQRSFDTSSDLLHQPFQGICHAIPSDGAADKCLRLLVEVCSTSNMNSQTESQQLNFTVSQLHCRNPRFGNWERNSAKSLQALLEAQRFRPRLREQRQLAVVFACSLFQLHESPCSTDQWDKTRIHFLYTKPARPNSEQTPNWQDPYMTTTFANIPQQLEQNILSKIHHHNPGILELGILLMEVNAWKPIDSLLKGQRVPEGGWAKLTKADTAFINNSFGKCSEAYRAVIEECIYLKSWAAVGGAKMTLENPQVWKRLYSTIVEPLKRELDRCLEMKNS